MKFNIELGETKTAMKAEEEEYKDVLEMWEEYEIDDQEDLDFAADVLREIKTKKKALITQRTEITGPISKGLEAARKLFRGPIRYLDACEKVIKGKIAQAHRKAQEKQDKALKQAGQASMKGDKEGAREALKKANKAELGHTKGVGLREVWDYEIVDFDALVKAVAKGEVSSDLLTVDDDEMMATVREQKGKTDIPGIRVFTRTSVSARTK